MAISNTCSCGGTADKPNRDCERCRLVYFFRAAVRMRDAQRAYFAGRTGQQLADAQQAERHVDRLIERLNEVQPSLFDDSEES